MLKFVAMQALAAGLFLWGGESQAFQFKFAAQQPYRYSNGHGGYVYGETVTGTYALDPNEKSVAVYIVSYNAQGGVSSTAQGVVNPNGTWTAALGDFQMAKYQISFRVIYGPNRVIVPYNTKVYPWATGP